MELISVKGDMEDINTYVNLYQKFSSIDGGSIEEARRRYMQNELERYKNRVSPLPVGDVEVIERDEVIVGSTADATPQSEGMLVETIRPSHGIMLDNLDEDTSDEEVEEVSSSSVLEEPCPSHGVMLDELDDSTDEEYSTPETDYGEDDIDEEEISRVEEPNNIVSVSVEDEEDDGSSWGEEDEDDGSSWGDEDDTLEDSSWEEDDISNDSSWDNEGDETSEESAWGDEEEASDNSAWGDEEDEGTEEAGNVGASSWDEEDEVSDESAWGDEEDASWGDEVIEPVVSEPPAERRKAPETPKPFRNSARFTPQREPSPVTRREVSVPTPKPVAVTKSMVNYPNVRAFVKGNPGCTSNDVLKYFSANELKKALLSSKVVEKKGKLYAV